MRELSAVLDRPLSEFRELGGEVFSSRDAVFPSRRVIALVGYYDRNSQISCALPMFTRAVTARFSRPVQRLSRYR